MYKNLFEPFYKHALLSVVILLTSLYSFSQQDSSRLVIQLNATNCIQLAQKESNTLRTLLELSDEQAIKVGAINELFFSKMALLQKDKSQKERADEIEGLVQEQENGLKDILTAAQFETYTSRKTLSRQRMEAFRQQQRNASQH